MNRFIIVLLMILFCFNFAILATAEQVDNTQGSLIERSLISLLVPIMKDLFIKYYGPKSSTQFYCEKITNIKQPYLQEGSNFFEIDMEAITFEGPHAPPHDLLKVRFTNYSSGACCNLVLCKI